MLCLVVPQKPECWESLLGLVVLQYLDIYEDLSGETIGLYIAKAERLEGCAETCSAPVLALCPGCVVTLQSPLA